MNAPATIIRSTDGGVYAVGGIAEGQVLARAGRRLQGIAPGIPGPHTHVQDDVTGLTAALAGKAAAAHTHAEPDITGLVADLAAKAAAVHSHAQADVTGLVAALAGKAAAVHTHAQADVTGLVSALAGKAAVAHGHTEADVTGLVADLAALSTAIGLRELAANKGIALGYAGLGADGKVPAAQLPAATVADPNPQLFAPGGFTVGAGKYVIMARRLKLTGAARAAVSGAANLRIV